MFLKSKLKCPLHLFLHWTDIYQLLTMCHCSRCWWCRRYSDQVPIPVALTIQEEETDSEKVNNSMVKWFQVVVHSVKEINRIKWLYNWGIEVRKKEGRREMFSLDERDRLGLSGSRIWAETWRMSSLKSQAFESLWGSVPGLGSSQCEGSELGKRWMSIRAPGHCGWSSVDGENRMRGKQEIDQPLGHSDKFGFWFIAAFRA